ncbi:adenosine deaminase [Clostridium brassicae]|uniref:Adenosine deaminase n=1 Tax=Clostridium brassicae TaxID=2999072 RepID=A0ABT4D4F3_9CLOT|nr:adenosine deaminase [Clostridium brassicae]MCY6957161.1 adenosine deaminase [Clostridium brassicae]
MKFLNLPKIELHCHLDGSVRPKTAIDIAKKEGINIPSLDADIIKQMMIAPLECASLDEYLERFVLPLKVMQSKESLRRISYELLEDAAKENVKYIEVRFAPLLHTEKGLNVKEIIESVLKGIKEAEKNFNIKGNLILSFLKHMSPDSIFDVIEQGRNFIGNGVVAVDLCGSEDKGFSKKFIEPIALAREYGYRITIHAGETGIGENVLEAVELLGAERIGHGVAIRDCAKAYNIVKEKGIILEMCPTSNIQTKAVNIFKEHPMYDFYKDGIKVTVNTDNRTVSNTMLTNECDILFNEFHITYEDYKRIYNDSVDACFIDDKLKKKLYI